MLGFGVLIAGVSAIHGSINAPPTTTGTSSSATRGLSPTSRNRGKADRHPASGANRERSVRSSSEQIDLGSATSPLVKPLKMLALAIGLLLFFPLAFCAIALWTRWYDRRRRRYTVFQLKAYRDEGVSLEQLRSLISSWSNLMFVRSRRFQRFFWERPLSPSECLPLRSRSGPARRRRSKPPPTSTRPPR